MCSSNHPLVLSHRIIQIPFPHKNKSIKIPVLFSIKFKSSSEEERGRPAGRMHPRAGNCSCLGSISPSPGVKSSALFLPTPQTRRSLSGRSPSLCVILAERARDRPSPRPPRKTTGRSGKGKNGR
ncbi:hypothetical protein SEVIR_5G131300v4 [Setaria viridis]|uniref:Uncharacterized protein n=1 Tax=Setaria viridis TaxID=4556 RepID=A0A4U6UD52_SETVI|nr:hypothetical protein SEVIR_5G131300v2 [Setaria viridis]